MIKKAWHTHAHTSLLISAEKSASQVLSVWEAFEKPVKRQKEGVTDWDSWAVTSEKNAHQINKLSHLETGKSLKCWTFQSLLSFQTISLFSSHRRGRHVISACVSGKAASHHMHTLYLLHSVPLCTNAPTEAVLLSKQRHAKTTRSLFLFPFLLSGSNLTPVLHQVCISLIPFSFNPPLRIYTPAARNEWFTLRGSLPPSESFATIHHSPASVPLISLCCVTLETPLRSRTCFLFFHAPSLALFLSYIQYWLFMLFNVAERARGLRTGEKRSSWHTYAPVVNSSSQHSNKYTDLLLFPFPSFFLCLFSFPVSFLHLGAPLNISTLCCSIPKITLWKIKMLESSSKMFTQ